MNVTTPATVLAPSDAAAPLRRRGVERRQKLLNAAQEVILECGYAAASVEEIVRRVGGSKTSVYAYFGSKEGLFSAMVREACEGFLREVAVPQALDGLLDQTLETFGLRFLALYTSPVNVKLIRNLIAEAPRFPELARQFYEEGPFQVRERLATFFVECHARGVLMAPDASFAAVQFITLIKGHGQYRSLFGLSPLGLPMTQAEFVRRTVELFLHGTAPPPS